jgi:hypothetical protein
MCRAYTHLEAEERGLPAVVAARVCVGALLDLWGGRGWGVRCTLQWNKPSAPPTNHHHHTHTLHTPPCTPPATCGLRGELCQLPSCGMRTDPGANPDPSSSEEEEEEEEGLEALPLLLRWAAARLRAVLCSQATHSMEDTQYK